MEFQRYCRHVPAKRAPRPLLNPRIPDNLAERWLLSSFWSLMDGSRGVISSSLVCKAGKSGVEGTDRATVIAAKIALSMVVRAANPI